MISDNKKPRTNYKKLFIELMYKYKDIQQQNELNKTGKDYNHICKYCNNKGIKNSSYKL